ncbi:MAG: NAD-dependent epimerase/dehydratase family protein [Flavobacteriales bacterium]|nr:NAD-dependent epimerase/dehydratase family protein [Flavobacteriales bacterium]
MATILITGGSGLIGTHLTSTLRTAGHTVRHLSRTPGAGATCLCSPGTWSRVCWTRPRLPVWTTSCTWPVRRSITVDGHRGACRS